MISKHAERNPDGYGCSMYADCIATEGYDSSMT